MPRDITHFLIAEHVQTALQPDLFWQPILRNINCLRVGSVFPDALYYLVRPCRVPAVKTLPDALHGKDGQDTFVIIKHLLTRLPDSQIHEQLLAFLAGIVTHLFTDMTFHPLVYFLTGNTCDPDKSTQTLAVQKHRQLETLIDIYFCGGLEHVGAYPLASYLRMLETEQHILFWNAARGFFPDDQKDEVTNAMLSAYKTFALVQAVCTHKILRRILTSLGRLLPPYAKEVTALLYAPPSKQLLRNIAGRLAYQHPLSGEPYTTTLQHLFHQAVDQSVDFCQLLKKVVSGEMSVEEVPVGPSLELATPGVAAAEMRYFASYDILGT